MDCSEVKELLSAYYDDELSSDKRAAMNEHISACNSCARELAGFTRLSAMAKGLTHPAPSAEIWQRLEGRLDVVRDSRSTGPANLGRLATSRTRVVGLAVVAATILVVIGWMGYRASQEHDDHGFTLAFGHYLDEFQRDPREAQQWLLAKYEGTPLDAGQAEHAVGYRPAVAGGLPAGYAVETTVVVKMPCCTCVQCLCKRDDGSMLAVFEHDDEETRQWFGERPEISAICHGTRCSLVELDDGIAATWRRGSRYITVIGARDAAEVEQLVAWFDDRSRS